MSRLNVCGFCGLLLIAVLFPSAAFAEEPRTAYWLHCAGCHLLDGSSAPPEVPTLIDEPGRIVALPGGRDYLMRIPGVAQAGLDDGKLAEVLNFMLEEFSAATLPRDFKPFGAAEVGRARQRVLIDPLKRRAAIVAD
jgi:hypothetical protein